MDRFNRHLFNFFGNHDLIKDYNQDIVASNKRFWPNRITSWIGLKPVRAEDDPEPTTSFEEQEYTPTEEDVDRMKRKFLHCAPDYFELGNIGWSLLHTISVNYPDKPNQEEKADILNFMHLFSKLFPCEPCAAGLRKDMKVHPPNVESGPEFAQWVCDTHNRVNKRLGRPLFDCSKVYERWRDGWKDGRCD